MSIHIYKINEIIFNLFITLTQAIEYTMIRLRNKGMTIKVERFLTSLSDDNLAWKEGSTMPIEHVAALSSASELGSDLLRARALDKQAHRRAILLLAHKAHIASKRKRLTLSPAQAQIFAATAIHEVTQPQCQTCRGAKVMISGKLKIVCHQCSGVGLHRYSDRDRATLSGLTIEEWPKWEKAYHLVMRILRGNDNATSLAKNRLGTT